MKRIVFRLERFLFKIPTKRLEKTISLSACVRSNDYNVEKQVELKPQELEALWQKQNSNLLHSFSKDEFAYVIQNIFNLVHLTESRQNASIAVKLVQNNIAQNLLNQKKNSQLQVLEKLKESSQNWSIIFDNLTLFMENKKMPFDLHVDYLFSWMHGAIISAIGQIQSHSVPQKASLIADLCAEKIDIDTLRLMSDLSMSLYDYMVLTKPELSTRLHIMKPPIRACLIYVEYYLLVNKKSLKSVDPRIEPYLAFAYKLVRLVMSQYQGLDSLLDELLNEFFYFFSFNENLWRKSVQWLLTNPHSNMAKSFETIYSFALKGSIRFEDMKTFTTLYGDLAKIRITANPFTENFQKSNLKICRDYLNLCCGKSIRKETNGDELETLLSAWSSNQIMPNTYMIRNLLEFTRLDFATSRWQMRSIAINTDGYCPLIGVHLKKAEFDPRALLDLAKTLQKSLFSISQKVDFIQERLNKDFENFEALLSNQKFDFVIDGLNVGYMKNHIYNMDNLERVLYLLKQNAEANSRLYRVLVVLRKHRDFPKKHEILLRQFNTKSSRIRLSIFYAGTRIKDDFFSLYAALKSGRNSYVITNDFFVNLFPHLNEQGHLFRNWILNRHVFVHPMLKKLEFPPEFEIRVVQVGNSTNRKWIIPYYIESDMMNYNFKFFQFYLCERIKNL